MLKFSVDDIITAIEEIDSNADSGPDEIPALFLETCKDPLTIPIHMIHYHSMAQGYVPESYRLSNISPLYKKDSKSAILQTTNQCPKHLTLSNY